MQARATLEFDHIKVAAPFRLGPLIKQVPGSRFNHRDDTWKLPATLKAVIQVYSLLGPECVTFDDALADQTARWKEEETRLQSLRRIALDPQYWVQEHDVLYPYQLPAVQYMDAAGDVLLADDQGTGKTVMAAHWLKNFPALVIVTRAVQRQWLKALERFHPGLNHYVLAGTATQRRKTLTAYMADPDKGALIVTYTQLPIHSRLAHYGNIRLTEQERTPKEFQDVTWGDVIADEAHKLFNPKTKWTRAAWYLGDNAKRRLAMTGTPGESCPPLDLLSLLRFVSPNDWPSRSKERDYFMNTEYDFFGGVESIEVKPELAEEWERVTSLRVLRRTKGLVAPWLPEKVYVTREVELPPKLRKQYDQLRKEMIAEVQGGELAVYDPVVLYSRLTQAASAQLEVVGTRTVVRDGEELEVADVRMCEPSPKLDDLLEFLEEAGGSPGGIYSGNRQLLDLATQRLEKAGYTFVSIVGGMSEEEIEEARTTYNEGHVQLCLISVSAAAEGLSLERGGWEYWLTRHARRLVNVQAEDRQHGVNRGDQDSDRLLIVDCVAVDTVEEDLRESLTAKGEAFDTIFPDPAAFLKAVG